LTRARLAAEEYCGRAVAVSLLDRASYPYYYAYCYEYSRGQAMTEIALMKAREKLTGLSRELQKNPGTVVRITNRGKPAMTLMSAELYDTLVETLDVVSDRASLDALRSSLRDIQTGKVHSLDEVAARLGLIR
jgi:antitoxin YefM